MTDNLGKSRTKTCKIETISNPQWNQFGYELLNCSLHLSLKGLKTSNETFALQLLLMMEKF
mgnify:CR=1 FL=1